MYLQEKRKNPRSAALFLDCVHVVIGILTVVLAVITFLDPEENRFLFPVFFFLAFALNGFNGIHKYRQSGRDRKKKRMAVVQLLMAVFLAVIMIISAVSIWR